jgi:hypothetical protein
MPSCKQAAELIFFNQNAYYLKIKFHLWTLFSEKSTGMFKGRFSRVS